MPVTYHINEHGFTVWRDGEEIAVIPASQYLDIATEVIDVLRVMDNQRRNAEKSEGGAIKPAF